MPHFRVRARRALASQHGATTVELALVATPFLLLLMGIFELALLLLANTALEDATYKAAREVRTGAFQTSGAVDAADFKELVCDHLAWMGSGCQARLTVDMRAYPTLGALAAGLAAPVDPEHPCFEAGGPGQVVLARAQMRWRIVTPLLRESLAGTADGARRLEATTAFRNEPFVLGAVADSCA